jgi:hypothetical protein
MSQMHAIPIKKRLSTKLIAGFTAFAATAVIGASSLALAAPADKPTKEQCNAAGFKNYGQCVKEWAHNKNKPGGGYGNGNNANINVNLELNDSNHNIIQVIVNFFS